MKNLKKKFRFRINLKSKHLLAIMTLFCLSCIVATFASGISTAPLQETAGIVIVPFEKSIEKIGSMVRSVRDSFKDKQDLLFENEELKAELEALYPGNTVHIDPLSLSVACHIGPGALAITATKVLKY